VLGRVSGLGFLKGLGVTNNFKSFQFYKDEERSFLNFKRVMNGGEEAVNSAYFSIVISFEKNLKNKLCL
jgi:hypothetical protein